MELQNKKYRILDIFFRLLKGEFVSVKQLADEYSVSGKTVSRDINEIKAYLSENGYKMGNTQIEYSHKEKAYYLSMDDFLSSKELVVLIEILLSSRSLPKDSMMEIIDKLESFILSKDKKLIALIPAAVNFLMVLYDCFFSASIHGESDFASVDVSLKLGGYLVLLAFFIQGIIL